MVRYRDCPYFISLALLICWAVSSTIGTYLYAYVTDRNPIIRVVFRCNITHSLNMQKMLSHQVWLSATTVTALPAGCL